MAGRASVLTVHLPLVGEDDLPPATWRVDGEGLLEALLDVRAPHALGVPVNGLVLVVPVQPIFWATVGAPLVGRNGGGSPWARPRAPKSKGSVGKTWGVKTREVAKLFLSGLNSLIQLYR